MLKLYTLLIISVLLFTVSSCCVDPYPKNSTLITFERETIGSPTYFDEEPTFKVSTIYKGYKFEYESTGYAHKNQISDVYIYSYYFSNENDIDLGELGKSYTMMTVYSDGRIFGETMLYALDIFAFKYTLIENDHIIYDGVVEPKYSEVGGGFFCEKARAGYATLELSYPSEGN